MKAKAISQRTPRSTEDRRGPQRELLQQLFQVFFNSDMKIQTT